MLYIFLLKIIFHTAVHIYKHRNMHISQYGPNVYFEAERYVLVNTDLYIYQRDTNPLCNELG